MKVDDVQKLADIVKKQYLSSEYEERRQAMNRYMKYFKGEYWREKAREEGATEIYANFIFSTITTIAPLLTDNRPIWYLRARKPFFQRFFETYSEAAEYLWDKEELDIKVYDWFVDAALMKIGLWKIYVEDGEIKIDVDDPRSFVMAGGYEDVWKAPWCATAKRQPLSWIKETFGKKAEEVKPDHGDDLEPNQDYKYRSSVEDSTEYATVFEIWARDETLLDPKIKKKKYPNGRIITVCQGHVLQDVESPFRHGKPPWVPLYDYRVPHEPFGMAEPDQIETMVLEFNLALRQLANYVRDYVDPDWAIDPNSGVDPEKFKTERKGGNNVWEVNTGTDAPRVLEMPGINRTILDFLSGIPDLIEEISGLTAITKGISEKKQRQTAGEIATLVESSYTRTRQRVRFLEAAIKRAMTLVVDLMQQYYDEPRPYTLVRDGQIISGQVSNQPGFAQNVMQPRQQGPQPTPEEQQESDDYHKLVEYIGGKEDPVYVDFDIEIQTNSTLPMDRQSLANLMLRLFEIKGVDSQALLETLRVPKADEIVQRLKEAQNADGQPRPPAGQPIPVQPG